jgi:hypothetical protein
MAQPRSAPALVQRHPNLSFWLAFVALSALLFLPLYLLNQETSTFVPESPFANGLWRGLYRLVLWRDNLDPWRLSLELTLLVALWVNFRRLQRPTLRWAIGVFYLVALCYALYEALMLTIYRADPVFYSQYYLARDGLPFLASHLQTSGWIYLAGLVGVVAAGFGVVTLVKLLLNSAAEPKLHGATRLTLTLLALLALFVAVRYQGYTARPEMAVSSLSFKLQQNVAASFQLYDDIASFDDSAAQQAYDYTQYQLADKPDIYLIFVESYGSVLYKRPDYRRAYTSLLSQLETQLAGAGWHSASALSESPTWGGGSWMAYTSLLFGLRIDSHPQYLALLNKYQVQHYPNLSRYLQSQGYYAAWVSSIADELDDQTWSKYIRFLGVDQWLRYRDLDYHGPRYGWGPAPPDQYVLNYAHELLQSQTDQPLLFLTLTQNSHYPWTPQPQLADDWRQLNDAGASDPAAQLDPAEKRQRYFQAITYQLQMLTDFVIDNGDEQSLFFLIGDHQPPQVSRRADGWATPIHLLSRSEKRVNAFADYGFTPGLKLATLEPGLHHEGFYSLLMRILLAPSEGGRIALPAYLPSGVIAGTQTRAGAD